MDITLREWEVVADDDRGVVAALDAGFEVLAIVYRIVVIQ